MPALETIIQTHHPALLAYATRLIGDRHLAEDITQETWIRAWRHLDRLTEDQGSVRAWLLRVAHNISVDAHRARRARPAEVDILTEELEHVATTPDPGDEIETRLAVNAILGNLTERHRTTLVAVYYADRTADSAATALGVPVGTIKSRVHNALRTLRSQLNVFQAVRA